MSGKINISGTLKLTGRDREGRVLWVKEEKNLITTAGFDLICDCLGKTESRPAIISHMAIGDGTAGEASDTALDSETDRETAVYAVDAGNKKCTFTAVFSDVEAATEYGLFNDASAGTMLNTAGFSAITVDELEIVATITLT